MTTRRQFFERLAQVGGVGAAYASMRALGMTGESTQPALLRVARGDARTRVLVLGAGIAGLVSAWELSQAGYDVTVLEARDRSGGRNWTVRNGTRIEMTDGSVQQCAFSEGQYFNAGPARLPSHHHAVLAYCKQFGVALETEVNMSRSAFMRSDKIHGGQPFRVSQAMGDSRGHLSELLTKAINRGRLDDQLTPDDRDRMVAFLRLYGDLDKDGAYAGSTRAGYQVTPGAFDRKGVPFPALSMHELLDADLWIAILFDEFVDWHATMMQPVGGMDRIPLAFESRLGKRIRRGREVLAIKRSARGVTVHHRDPRKGDTASLDADYVICTLPFSVLAGIEGDFSPDVKSAIARVKYDHSLKVAFEAPRFWEEQQIYGGISYVKGDTGLVWYPSHGFQSPRGIVLGAYANGLAAARLGEKPLAQRIAAASEAIERVHPGCSPLLSHGVNVTWAQVPYSLGPWVKPWDEPDGNDIADYTLLNQPDGPLYFASANLSQIPGWQEGAVLSAQRVVEMISQRAAQTSAA